jgi:hypothetical protein
MQFGNVLCIPSNILAITFIMGVRMTQITLIQKACFWGARCKKIKSYTCRVEP